MKGRIYQRPHPHAATLIACILLVSGAASCGPPVARLPGIETLIDEERYDEAAKEARSVLSSTETRWGSDSLECVPVIDALVLALSKDGRSSSDECLALARRSLEIRERRLSPGHPDVAISLSRLGVVTANAGDLLSARACFERGVALCEAAGIESELLAKNLNGLANVHRMSGEYVEAFQIYERALDVSTRHSGADSLGAASTLDSIGRLLELMGDPVKARDHLLRSIRIRTRHGQTRGIEVLNSQIALCRILARLGESQRARALLEAALRSARSSLSPDHPMLGSIHAALAQVLLDEGEYFEARSHSEEAVRIQESSLGPGHPRLAKVLLQLAQSEEGVGDLAGARFHAGRAADISRKSLGNRHPSVAAALVVAARIDLRDHRPDDALEAALEAEGISRAHFRSTSRRLDEEDALRFGAVRASGLDVALSVLAARARDDGTETPRGVAAVWEALVASRAIVLQEMAGRHSAASATDVVSSWKRLAPTLPSSYALVSYVRYNRIEAGPGERRSLDGVPSYIGLIARGGRIPSVSLIGPASITDDRVERWRRTVSAPPRDLAEIGHCREVGEALRRTIWDPFSKRLQGCRMALVVPDGAIGFVSLSALPAGRNGYLVERGPLIHYLPMERQAFSPPAAFANRGVLVVGDPAYGEKSLADGGMSGTEEADCCNPLPESLREADEIAATWSEAGPRSGKGRPPEAVTLLVGASAEEDAFVRECPLKRIIHVATHSLVEVPRSFSSPWGATPALAFAGVNHRDRTPPEDSRNDGLLTSEEIERLDLRGTEWVVLSGCGTGLGPVQKSEGVLGLRRAFQVAGARTVITSLWPVADEDALEWNRALHEARRAGYGTAEAVREATLRMIHRRRRAGTQPHPFSWGAFVASGDWQ